MSEKRPVILMNMKYDTINSLGNHLIIDQYTQRVVAAGGIPLLAPVIEDPALIAQYISMADGVLLIGGKDYHPEYYGEKPGPMTDLSRKIPHYDIAFCEQVLETSLPVLGICAGCQLLAICSGGKLIQHLPNAETDHRNGRLHKATVLRNGFLSEILKIEKGNSFTVNSFHHQAVNPDYHGNGFEIAARAFDDSVEVIERPGRRMVMGVQFHPERMNDDIGPRFFQRLVQEC